MIDAAGFLEGFREFSEIGRDADGGMQRIAYSPEDRRAHAWIAQRMVAAGMTVRNDAAGNTIGHYPGSEPQRAPIGLGSHTDSVPSGGRFDGVLGVLGAIACVAALHRAGRRLRHPIEAIDFAAEEGTMPGGTVGSRAMAGNLPPENLGQPAWDGRTLADHLQGAGLTPARIGEARRAPGSLAAYLELHIEQGGILDREHCALAAVEGIVGMRHYAIAVGGRANHAGTTPMELRDDALVKAAPLIARVSEIARECRIIATVGRVRVVPGAPNVIPGAVELSLDMRSLDEDRLDRAEAAVRAALAPIGASLESFGQTPVAPADPSIFATIQRVCADSGLPWRTLPSGAGHDAMNVARLAPYGMIFVPSRGGVSHAPDEFTDDEALVVGVRALLTTLERIDAEFD